MTVLSSERGGVEAISRYVEMRTDVDLLMGCCAKAHDRLDEAQELETRLELVRWQVLKALSREDDEVAFTAATGVLKLLWSELWQEMTRMGIDSMCPAHRDHWRYQYLEIRSVTIYAGCQRGPAQHHRRPDPGAAPMMPVLVPGEVGELGADAVRELTCPGRRRSTDRDVRRAGSDALVRDRAGRLGPHRRRRGATAEGAPPSSTWSRRPRVGRGLRAAAAHPLADGQALVRRSRASTRARCRSRWPTAPRSRSAAFPSGRCPGCMCCTVRGRRRPGRSAGRRP